MLAFRLLEWLTHASLVSTGRLHSAACAMLAAPKDAVRRLPEARVRLLLEKLRHAAVRHAEIAQTLARLDSAGLVHGQVAS